MRKTKLWCVVALLLLVSLPVHAQQPIKLWVNGNYVNADVSPVIQNDRTLVPIRFISEELGYSVSWDQKERSVTIVSKTDEGNKVYLVIGNRTALVKDNMHPLDAPARIINSRTFVPLRFIAETFNEKVNWDSANRTAIVGDGYIAPKIEVPEGTVVPQYLYDGKLTTLPLSQRMEYEIKNGELPSKEFPGFRNKDVEASIVWISLFNLKTNYAYQSGVGQASLEDGELIREFIFKGEPINPYADGNGAVWPRHITSVYNDTSNAMMTSYYYSPNYDGTIIVFYPPSRWDCIGKSCAPLEKSTLSNAKIIKLDKIKKEDIQTVLNSIARY